MDKTKDEMKLTVQKYLGLMNMISTIENRMTRSELTYLIVNVLVFLVSTTVLRPARFFGYPFSLFWLLIGMYLCTFWIATSLRLQLKLKLRYFQARYLERKMNTSGEYFFSDEGLFFNPEIRKIESPDEEELLEYPVKGFKRMDGFVGAAKPRHLTWILPSVFFIFYVLTFIYFLFD
ncbi:MAG: hypothetical protein PVH84_16060 [Candidatus Aminicenantes bacterium]|jgi:hypothetical protein